MDINLVAKYFGNIDNFYEVISKSIEKTGVGVSLTDPSLPDNPLVYVNKSFETMTGYKKDEILGKNCRFLQGKDKEQKNVAILSKSIKDGKRSKLVLRNYKKNGELFWNELVVSPIKINGKIKYFLGVQQDITSRIDALNKLKQENERNIRLNKILLERETRIKELKKKLDYLNQKLNS